MSNCFKKVIRNDNINGTANEVSDIEKRESAQEIYFTDRHTVYIAIHKYSESRVRGNNRSITYIFIIYLSIY